ncbi:MAG: ATP-binding protein [Candidatus Aminicenantes bacterium]|jgi:PAS domain S-box-containing protein
MVENEKLKKDRIDKIIEAIMKVGQGDFSVQIEISDKNDDIDSLAMGINMMIDNIREAHEKLSFNNTILETQLETSIDGILVVDDQGKVISHNKRFAQMWSISDELLATKDDDKLLSFVFSQLRDPDEFINKVRYLYSHREEKSRDEIPFKDGKVFDRYSAPLISPTGQYFGRIWFFRDITDWKRMQEQLLRQEKLAVLGQLAGGVGHELRNPLGVIKNAAYFLNIALESPDPEVKETLELLEKEVLNAERIISSLLDFARAKPPLRRKADIHQILREALSRVNVPENITVEYPLKESLPQVLADPGQLDQVFKNIILNAVQAMPEGGGLSFKIDVQEPDWISITITDTGMGIPGENIKKIFEPLFTGKAKGIGLGMAITKTFVEGHGGSIDVKSDPGKGSTFTIKLPIRKS